MWFVFWVPGVLLVIAAVVDLKRREVPDVVPILILCWALAATASGWLTHSWWQVALGAMEGLGIGGLLFFLGGFGGGDAKILASLGALLGPLALLVALVFIGLSGGALALVARLRSEREHAYVPAIAAGYILFIAIAGFTNGRL